MELEEESIEFGLENTLNAIAANNALLIVISEDNATKVTLQVCHNYGLMQFYSEDREEM